MYEVIYLNNVKAIFSNFSKAVLPVIGILLFVSLAFLMIYWETSGRERFMYKPVIVLKEDVTAGTVLNDDSLLAVQWVEYDNVIDGSIIDPELVIGRAASHFIPKGTQLHPNYFEDKDLILQPGQYIFKIPNDWIYSVPDSLRRKDIITIVETKNETPKEIMNGQESNNMNLNTYTPDKAGDLVPILGGSLFETITSYVKDANNREVVTVSLNDRYDGSSKINSVEVIITLEQFKKMKASVANGNKFVIMYSGGILNESSTTKQ